MAQLDPVGSLDGIREQHQAESTYETLEPRSALQVQLVCAWSGVVLLVGFLVGWAWLAGMIPPTSPTGDPESIRRFFMDDLTQKRVGILLAMSVWGLLIPWGVALSARVRQAEPGFPTLTMVQIGCAVSTAALGVLMMMIWGVVAYRPDDMSVDTARVLNDLGWFVFLIDWAPVTFWVWAFAAAVLMDRRTPAPFSRSVGYFSLWTGLIFFPAGLILFFKTGPFAYNGALALYLPGGVFFLWFAVVTALLIRSLSSDLAEVRRSRPAEL